MTTDVRESLLDDMAGAMTWGRVLMQKHNATPLLSVDDVIGAVKQPGGAYLAVVNPSFEWASMFTSPYGNLPRGVRPRVIFIHAHDANKIDGARELQERLDRTGPPFVSVPFLDISYESRSLAYLLPQSKDFRSGSPFKVSWDGENASIESHYLLKGDSIADGRVNELPQLLVNTVEESFANRYLPSFSEILDHVDAALLAELRIRSEHSRGINSGLGYTPSPTAQHYLPLVFKELQRQVEVILGHS